MNRESATYEIELESFRGPLEKLLEFIEEKKLDVSEVSLASVTDDFLKYVLDLKSKTGDNPSSYPRVIADYIVVLSQLILIKSRSLLPDIPLTQEEETGIHDLERRLILYRELRKASRLFLGLYKSQERSLSRPYFLSGGGQIRLAEEAHVFYPGKNLEPQALIQAIERIVKTVQAITLQSETIKEKIVSIEEKIKEIIGRLESETITNVSALARSKSRSEIIAIFLAVLHLARDQFLELEQEGSFSDIIIKKKT